MVRRSHGGAANDRCPGDRLGTNPGATSSNSRQIGTPRLADHEFRPSNDKDQYWMVIKKGKGYVDVQLPKALVKDRPKTIELMWITQFTR